jgi:hypothetical protein
VTDPAEQERAIARGFIPLREVRDRYAPETPASSTTTP